MSRLRLFLLLLPLAVACSTSSAARPSARGTSDVITETEAAGAQVSDAYQLVQRLRPQFLRTRGEQSIMLATPIIVYVDGNRFGGVEMLRQISALDVKEIRWLSATDATQRYGTDHASGAILVTRK